MSIIVAVRTTKGAKYVSIVEVTSVVENGVRKQKHKTIKSLGRLDRLLENDPDALTKLRDEYKSPEQKYREQSRELLDKHLQGIKITDEQLQKKIITLNLNYGIWALKPIWDEILTLKNHIYYLQNHKSEIKFNVNSALSYLTFLKVIDPKSQLKAFNHQTKFLCSPLKDIELHDLYRTLFFAYQYKDDLFTHINQRICDTVGRSMSMIFYDCTNCYFETPYDDKQLLERKIINLIKAERMQSGMSHKEFSEYINTQAFRENFSIKFSDAVDGGIELFRMHGMSKEHRYDLPLISVALVIDDKGIPIDFEIFSGNTSEFKTMPVLIEQMKGKYNIKSALVVADRGLNSIGNLLHLLEYKLGFIVAQKVTSLGKELESQMLELSAYKQSFIKDLDKDISHDSYDSNDDIFRDKYILYRRLPYVKTGYVKDEITGEKRFVKIDCEIIFTFSETRKNRDLAQLHSDILKAQEAISMQKDMAPVCSSGWRSLVKIKMTDGSKTKAKNTNMYTAKALKQELVEKRKRLAGFSASIYKKPDCISEELEDDDIIGAYKKLVRIEDCFRVMKSNFSIRPMYVRNKEHITGHVTICVMALILLRLLQIKIQQSGHDISVDEIIETLSNANVMAHSNNGCDGFFTNAQCHDNIYSEENRALDKNEPYLTPIDKYIRKLKAKESNLELILKAVGLTPLEGTMTAKEVSSNLKVVTGYERLVGVDNCKIQAEMAKA